MTRRQALHGLAAVLTGCWGPRPSSVSPPKSAAEVALEKGRAWLWAQQGPDGNFPSQTYGFFGLGQSLTPFLLLAAPAPPRVADPALAWMARARTGGALGFAAVAPDYPVYATGMYLSVLGRYQPSGWKQTAASSVAWLRTQQYGPEWGDHRARGGFGMGLRKMPSPPHAGHVDLSMTRRAVQGLRAVGVPTDDPALVEAGRFVEACRSPVAGFLYSPTEPMVNKGVRTGEQITGYGSATCDALLALHALGKADAASLTWLHSHHRVDRNPGIGDGPYAAFAEAMKGYYRDGASAVFAVHGGPVGWKDALAAAIVAEQRPDGSWLNPRVEQKENDPLVSTGFALAALARALRS